jgi:hypothetical protein
MDQTHRTETREYVWRHWAFHADQRLRTFHFYILVVTVLVAGILAYIKDARYPAYAAPGGFLLAIASYVFWRLDCRNRVLIRHAEEILKAIEGGIPAEAVPPAFQLFTQEEITTNTARAANRAEAWWHLRRWWQVPLSFYQSFRLLFLVFGASGVVIGVATCFLPGQQPNAAPPPPQQNFYIGTQPGTAMPATKP